MTNKRRPRKNDANLPAVVPAPITFDSRMAALNYATGGVGKLLLGVCAAAVFLTPLGVMVSKSNQDTEIIKALLHDRVITEKAVIAAPAGALDVAPEPAQAVEVASVDIPADAPAIETVMLPGFVKRPSNVIAVVEAADEKNVDLELDTDEIVKAIEAEVSSVEAAPDAPGLSPLALELMAEIRAQAGTSGADEDPEGYASGNLGYVKRPEAVVEPVKLEVSPIAEPDIGASMAPAGSLFGGVDAGDDTPSMSDIPEGGDVPDESAMGVEDDEMETSDIAAETDLPEDDLDELAEGSADEPAEPGVLALAPDLIAIDGMPYHLAGTMKVDPSYECAAEDGTGYDCDDWALSSVMSGLAQGDVVCTEIEGAPRSDGSVEASCNLIAEDADPVDLAQWSVMAGINFADPDDQRFAAMEAEAKESGQGLWSGTVARRSFPRPKARPEQS